MTDLPSVVIFDLDGTLLDSDDALAAAFVNLGVAPGDVTRGHVVAEECARLGISLEDYLAAYDTEVSEPFPGVEAMLAGVGRWAVCSNKHPRSGRRELERLGWMPEVALFADAFDGPKALPPVLDLLGVDPGAALFVGDTAHDEACAASAGTSFAWAGWNPRTTPSGGWSVLADPAELSRLLAGASPGDRGGRR